MMEGEKHMKRGFTLMELIVVMAILAILSIMVMGNYKATLRKKNDLKRKSDLTQRGKSLELYNNDFGRYPGANNGLMQACGATGDSDCTWGTSVMENQTSGVIYMAKIPADPLGSRRYYYVTDGRGTHYRIYAALENLDDPAVNPAGFA